MKTTKLNYEQQYNIAEKFILYNTKVLEDRLNYKMTSRTWVNVISKWAGVEISIGAVNEVMRYLEIESVRLAEGTEIYVFACDIIK
jgi:hypothetical protein